MAESSEPSPDLHQRKRCERDGHVLLWIAAGFLLASLAAAAAAQELSDFESHYAAMAFSAVGLSATMVFGIWGLSLYARKSAGDSALNTIRFLRRLSWKSSRRKIVFHVTLAFLAMLLSHFIIIAAIAYSNQSGTTAFQERRILPYLADPALSGVQFDVVLSDGNVGHVICIPPESWNPKTVNWYERRFRANFTDESETTLKQLGWPRELLHKQVELAKVEMSRLDTVQPMDRESLFTFAHSHPNWIVEHSDSTRIEIPTVLSFYHDFFSGAKLWIEDDSEKTVLRRDVLGKTRLILYHDKKRGTTVFVQPSLHEEAETGPDSNFSILTVCLASLFAAWLFILTPFFYLRLLPKPSASNSASPP